MFCSTIIPTIGRDTLARAVNSVLTQKLPDAQHEIIVVNDSGTPLPSANWQQSPLVRVIDTNQTERSVARNTGATMAHGDYLHFLDDDDWLAEGALPAFFQAIQQHSKKTRFLSQNTTNNPTKTELLNTPAWVYGSSQLVNRQGEPLLQLHHQLQGNCFMQVMAGEWIPLQASLIRTDVFFELGGFNPLLTGPEDIDLLRRVALHHDLVEMSRVVAILARGNAGSSTNYDMALLAGRVAREKILGEKTAFHRMRESAHNSYWQGRIIRAYVTSMVWNLRRKRLFTAIERGGLGVMGLLLGGKHWVSSDFWRAVRHPYASESFARGWELAGGMPA